MSRSLTRGNSKGSSLQKQKKHFPSIVQQTNSASTEQSDRSSQTFTTAPETVDEPRKTTSVVPDSNQESISQGDMIIAVMGPTGAGKSSFINMMARRSSTEIGHNLNSCTHDVQVVRCRHPTTGREVVFVDTPGFDDTNLEDTVILESIAEWLNKTYKQKITLTGLLFLHRISDNRMAGTPLRNLHMFQKLCGEDALQNVLFITTMWDEVDEQTGSKRERELLGTYWQAMIKFGSRTCRSPVPGKHNSSTSAWKIVAMLNKQSPRAVLLQTEMVDRGLELRQTAAGRTLFSWLTDVIENIKEIIRKLEDRIRNLSKDNKGTDAEELRREKSKEELKLQKINTQRQRLDSRAFAIVREVIRRSSTLYSWLMVNDICTTQEPASAIHSSSATSPTSIQYCSSPLELYPGYHTSSTFTSTSTSSRPSNHSFPIPTPPAISLGNTQTVSDSNPLQISPAPSDTSLHPFPTSHIEKVICTESGGILLQGTITALRAAQQAVNGCKVPFLQGAVGLVLWIAEFVSRIRDAERSLVLLAQNAGWLIVAVTDQFKLGNISDDMKQAIKQFVSELQGIKNIVKNIASRNKSSRYILLPAEEKIVLDCNNCMKMACELLGIKVGIINRHQIEVQTAAIEAQGLTLARIEKLLTARLTQHYQLPELLPLPNSTTAVE